ncbi:hypothetical protein BpHYR1_019723 [Brachionus plicatilis]|uniref:Uncharacterized protein n=1 Tax=Brachionus plicatilis TaxID=10195 RepID=A0A3M7PZ76_BRAPC|nr:hypothetical protein BpHYR1_019723 [Brachionus plicatilis]
MHMLIEIRVKKTLAGCKVSFLFNGKFNVGNLVLISIPTTNMSNTRIDQYPTLIVSELEEFTWLSLISSAKFWLISPLEFGFSSLILNSWRVQIPPKIMVKLAIAHITSKEPSKHKTFNSILTMGPSVPRITNLGACSCMLVAMSVNEHLGVGTCKYLSSRFIKIKLYFNLNIVQQLMFVPVFTNLIWRLVEYNNFNSQYKNDKNNFCNPGIFDSLKRKSFLKYKIVEIFIIKNKKLKLNNVRPLLKETMSDIFYVINKLCSGSLKFGNCEPKLVRYFASTHLF